MEGYCAVYTRVSVAQQDARTLSEQRAAAERLLAAVGPQGGCYALLEPYLDQVAAELIAEQGERDSALAASDMQWEGGR